MCVLCVLQATQQANFEAWKVEETKQLANRRRVLDKQQKVSSINLVSLHGLQWVMSDTYRSPTGVPLDLLCR
jgi:hypothetical protein